MGRNSACVYLIGDCSRLRAVQKTPLPRLNEWRNWTSKVSSNLLSLAKYQRWLWKQFLSEKNEYAWIIKQWALLIFMIVMLFACQGRSPLLHRLLDQSYICCVIINWKRYALKYGFHFLACWIFPACEVPKSGQGNTGTKMPLPYPRMDSAIELWGIKDSNNEPKFDLFLSWSSGIILSQLRSSGNIEELMIRL